MPEALTDQRPLTPPAAGRAQHPWSICSEGVSGGTCINRSPSTPGAVEKNRALVTLSRLWTECLQHVFFLLARCRKGEREVRGMGTCRCHAIALNPGQRHQGSTSSTSLRLRLQKVGVRAAYLPMPRTLCACV